MSVSLYKPNSKNTGCGFSFQTGVDNKNKEPALYVKAIKQHSWDQSKKQGYFSKNAGDPEKNIVVKFNEFECGEIINSINNRKEYNTFHSFANDKTVIKFNLWDKKTKKSEKSASGEWKEVWVTIPAFSISFTRNGNQVFGIGLEPGEAEVIKQYLQQFLSILFSERIEKQQKQMQNKNQTKESKESKEEKIEELDEFSEEAPF
jgi:hypothetical protein